MRDWDTRAMSGRSTLCPVGRHSARTPQPGAQGHSLDFGRILTTFLIVAAGSPWKQGSGLAYRARVARAPARLCLIREYLAEKLDISLR